MYITKKKKYGMMMVYTIHIYFLFTYKIISKQNLVPTKKKLTRKRNKKNQIIIKLQQQKQQQRTYKSTKTVCFVYINTYNNIYDNLWYIIVNTIQ